MELHAYTVGSLPMTLIPAPASRHWMEETPQGFARRCLPLLLANASGWLILNPVAFRATWNGGEAKTCMEMISLDPAQPLPALSHFGSGVITWNVPWLMRTPPGYNLLVRGPANLPKDGIAPLEGLVEADSETVATFTMNWKFTRRGTITFEQDEPFCMLVPQARGDLEAWQFTMRDANEDTALQQKYQAWSASRTRFNGELERQEPKAVRQQWQKDYFQAAEQTKRRLACPMHAEGGQNGDSH